MEWRNFKNIPISFLSRVLQNSMSSTYEDEGPLPGFRTEMAIYYIVYFVVFPFFFVNIFVALVIVTFNELGEAELTDNIDKNQVILIVFLYNGLCYNLLLYPEILHHVRGPNQAPGGLRSRDSDRSEVSHLETRHLPALRELHHAPHHPQHPPPHVQGDNLKRK